MNPRIAGSLLATLLVALWRAARARHLTTAGILAAIYLQALDAANALAWRHEDGGHVLEGFIVVFLGPAGALGRARTALPGPTLFIAHPAAIQVAVLVLATAVVAILQHECSELPRARALDAIALPLVFVGVMEGVVLVLAKLADALVEDVSSLFGTGPRFSHARFEGRKFEALPSA